MLKKWQAIFDGDQVYSLKNIGPLFDRDEEEFPEFGATPEGDMLITVLAEDIRDALQIIICVIADKEWEDE